MRGANPPTAWLVSRSRHALTAVGCLLKLGVRIPEDMALVCRDGDQYMADNVPSIARYQVDMDVYARRCARALIQMATAGRLRPSTRRIMARFIAGETLGPPSAPPALRRPRRARARPAKPVR